MNPTTNTVAGFDPSEHTVAEVVEHLDANPDDAARVLEVEQSGKARKGVLEHSTGDTVTSDHLGRAVEDGRDYLGRAVG
jgi:hypothetical protein